MDIETAIADVMAKTNLVRSLEADFMESTWTFEAPYLVVSGGEYVVIPKTDWTAFLSHVRNCAANMNSSSSQDTAFRQGLDAETSVERRAGSPPAHKSEPAQ